jgi:hypothetical protein
MAENWSERERQTNRLVRSIAAWLFRQSEIRPEQLSGLAKLTWITDSRVNKDTYINSVKIPALGLIFDRDYSQQSLAQIANDVARLTGNARVRSLILNETGFTNIYNAYRNSSADWIRNNFKKILSLMKAAYDLNSDVDGRLLAEQIDALPPIGKPDQSSSAMHPANLLTPIAFALDKRIRFPILNGRKHVRHLLVKRGVINGTLPQKFDAMVSLYGKAGIRDAADLDQVSDELEHFLVDGSAPAKRKLLHKKKVGGKHLPLKDENDLEVVQQERTAARKKLHNKMTNRLRDLWKNYTLTEGAGTSAQYDVMVKNYDDKGHDLIMEVKSSSEIANLRMAVGQLYSYSYRMDENMGFHLCVLLPNKPSASDSKWLDCLDVGLMWFSGDKLKTDCDWLAHLT